jgi:Na+-translocating ferredoxin:NAD+ oxidoreductase subunit B
MPSADELDALLPQTQCGRCGYGGCRPYAEALAADAAPIDRCPPGGAPTVAALARALGRAPVPLDPAFGREAPPAVAVIDEAACIGCAKCLPACPVDAILGASKFMHTVIAAECSGCELCLPACPVDCIRMLPTAERPLAAAALSARAGQYRRRYGAHLTREAERAGARERALAAHRPGAKA